MTPPTEPRPELACFAGRLPLLRRAWSSHHPHQRPMTQERLAEAVGVDARTVRDWEKGRQRPRTLRVAERLATALEVSQHELGLGSAVAAPTVALGPERLALVLGPSGRLESRLGVVDPVEAAYAAIGMDRRDFLGLIGTLLAALPGGGMEAAERVTHALSSSRRRVDPPTVEALEQLTTYLCQEGPRVPVHELLPDLRRHLELLVALQATLQQAAVQHRLVSCIGRTTRLIGAVMTWDLADLATGKAYYDIALRAARETDDSDLLALTLAERSHVVAGFLTGRLVRAPGDRDDVPQQTAEALQLVEAAHAYAKRGQVTTRLHVLPMVAALYADAGREADFRRLQDQAQGLLADLGDEVWTGSNFITRPRVLSYEGLGLVRLGLSHAAEPVITAALDQLASDPGNSKYRCFVYGHRAGALLQRDDPEVDEACRCIGEMLDMAVHFRRATAIGNARELHRQLQPWSDTAAVRELTERLAAAPLSA
jgi:DNA-binding XRE family transcriptional regulator